MRTHLILPVALLAVASACTDRAPAGGAGGQAPEPEEELLAPPAEGEGIQVKMITTLEPGTEVEHCQFFRAPPEGLNVHKDLVRYSNGSHHVLLYLTPYTDIPTEDVNGAAVDTSGVFDCSEGATFGWDVVNLVAGSQNAEGDSVIDFPEGVAMKVPPNSIFLLNAHYINASSEPLTPEVRVNLYTIPDEEVVEEGGLLFWYDPFIKVAANGTGRATMSCPLPDDVTIRNAQSHMHKRGSGYEATLVSPEGARESIYQGDSWENVPVRVWEEGLDVAAGSHVEFRCDYENPEDRTVYQGPRTKDEMCMFISSYWPAKPSTSLCAPDVADAYADQSLAGSWIGNGDKSCAASLVCVSQIEGADGGIYDFLARVTDCIDETRPESSATMSAALRCFLSADDAEAECEAEIDACLAD